MSGCLTDELYVFKEIRWKLSGHYLLSNTVDKVVKSPPFSFARATWVLSIAPNGLTDIGSEGWINLIIERKESEIPEHDVFCEYQLKTWRENCFKPLQGSYIFNAHRKSNFMAYMEKQKFLHKEKNLITRDILIIACKIYTKDGMHGIENFSQTELVGPVVGCDAMPQHPAPGNKVVEDLKELFLNQEKCDVVIKVKGKEFSAHRAILRARSPVFASMFTNDMNEKAAGVIDVEDCDPSSFSDFLYYLYCGNVENISPTNVFGLFVAADKYMVQDLRSECLKFIEKNLSVDTFCDTFALAIQHVEKKLVELGKDFFIKNFKEIIVTKKWETFLLENTIEGNQLMIKATVSDEK